MNCNRHINRQERQRKNWRNRRISWINWNSYTMIYRTISRLLCKRDKLWKKTSKSKDRTSSTSMRVRYKHWETQSRQCTKRWHSWKNWNRKLSLIFLTLTTTVLLKVNIYKVIRVNQLYKSHLNRENAWKMRRRAKNIVKKNYLRFRMKNSERH